ncbi:MAG TPA: hypothetical protein VH639_25430 [Bryobacteraceae bacterium]|jgi:hypothetical protein
MHFKRTGWQRFAAAICLFAAATCDVPLARAQLSTMSTMVQEAERAGFGFYDLSVFGTYSTARTPVFGPGGTLLPSFSFHTDAGGVMAQLGWRAPRSKKWRLSVQYTPAYYYQTSSTGFSASRFSPRQSANLTWGTPLSPRWNLNTSLAVNWGDYNQLILLANPAQILAGTPGTPAQFGAGLVANANGSGPAQTILSGQQNLLYGGTLLTAAASVGVRYAATQRLSLTTSVNGSRMQHLGSNGGPQSSYLTQQGTFLGVNLGLSYQLSPRTGLFGSVTYSRSISSLFDTPTTSLNMGLSHSITPHWFASGSLGAGYIFPTGKGPTYVGFRRTGWQASFSTGYRLYRQSFVLSVSRTVSDNFGLGATGTLYTRGGWHWSPPASHWGLTAGFSELRLLGTPFANQGYIANAGVNHAFGGRLFSSLRYGYGQASGVIGVANPIFAHSHFQTIGLNFGFHPYFGKPDAGAFPDAGP